jgi:hypothetical protein
MRTICAGDVQHLDGGRHSPQSDAQDRLAGPPTVMIKYTHLAPPLCQGGGSRFGSVRRSWPRSSRLGLTGCIVAYTTTLSSSVTRTITVAYTRMKNAAHLDGSGRVEDGGCGSALVEGVGNGSKNGPVRSRRRA